MNIQKKLLLSFLVFLIIKSLLSLLISTPTIYTDEYIYLKSAQSFFINHNFMIHNLNVSPYPPLYSIIISISYIFSNAHLAYILTKIINAILSSLIIFPSYFLVKEFLSEDKAWKASLLVSVLPMNFAFSAYIMSENLFHFLFMFSVYFIYKSFSHDNYKYDILAGIFIGLSFLTKFAGVSLIIITILLFLYKIIKKDYLQIKKKIIMGFFTLITITPWLLNKGIVNGFTVKGIIGQYSLEATNKITYNYFSNLIYWLSAYTVYVCLASGIIFFLLAFSSIKELLKDNKLKLFALLTLIIFIVILVGGANHTSKLDQKEKTLFTWLNGRPIGRYLDTTLPILILFGFVSYYKLRPSQKNLKVLFLLLTPIFIIGSQLYFFKLLPVNNLSLSWLGIIQLILSRLISINVSVILITVFSIILLFFCYKLINSNKIIPLIFVFFFLVSLLSFTLNYYNSKLYWENNEQIKLSSWLNSNINKESNILIDEDYCGNFNKLNETILCSNGKSTSIIGLWITNNLTISSLENKSRYDYIITLKKLNLELIKKTENNIYVFKSV